MNKIVVSTTIGIVIGYSICISHVVHSLKQRKLLVNYKYWSSDLTSRYGGIDLKDVTDHMMTNSQGNLTTHMTV